MISIGLSKRKQKILSAIVESYIENGEPVSSKNLCNTLNLGVSSATLRNEMAELTEFGYLEQPHTSAGRVPSYKGYRLYINELMNKKIVPAQARKFIDDFLETNSGTPENLLSAAANVLADITKCAVVTTICSNDAKINSINLLKTGDHTAMIVVCLSTGMVKSKIFKISARVTEAMLKLFSTILNENFLTLPVSSVTLSAVKDVLLGFSDFSDTIKEMLKAFWELCQDVSKKEVYLEGQTNLLFFPDVNSYEAVNTINLLKEVNSVDQIFLKAHENQNALIGKESNCDELANSSVIVNKYCVNGQEFGSIGVVGPMRMDYGALMSYVDYLTLTIGNLLGDILEI